MDGKPVMSKFNEMCLHTIRGIRTPGDVVVYLLVIVLMVVVVGASASWVHGWLFADHCEEMVVMDTFCRYGARGLWPLAFIAGAFNVVILINGLRLRNGKHKVAPNKAGEEW